MGIEKNFSADMQPVQPLDLRLWKEFQEGLSSLLDISISLYDSRGALLMPSSRETCLCDAVKAIDAGYESCRETTSKAIAQVLDKSKTYIYKCHTNQYIFAIPVFLDTDCSYVIIGGQSFLSGNEVKDFYEGSAPHFFDEPRLNELKGAIKTIPPKSIFTLSGIVNNLTVPFLKCIYNLSGMDGRGHMTSDEERVRLKGFYELEQMYKSLAPVLDRDELYETILNKSAELVGAEKGSLMILDNKSSILSVKAAKGIERSVADGLKIKIGEGISGFIAAKGLPVIVRDIEADIPSRKNNPKYRTKSFISIPLKLDSRVIGVLNVADKITGEVFSEEDLHLLLSFANYASIALERGAYYSMSEELKMLSMTDPLTGLFNRRYLHERVFEEVERVKRHNGCFTVFMIDIDNFKSYNDSFGHLAGDEILKGVARAIRDTVRSMDVVSRYGGEEFAVILPHTTKKESLIIAERIRKEVEGLRSPTDDLMEYPTVSLGIAEYPDDAGNIDELIHKADCAMYRAKRTGKNRVVLYTKDIL